MIEILILNLTLFIVVNALNICLNRENLSGILILWWYYYRNISFPDLGNRRYRDNHQRHRWKLSLEATLISIIWHICNIICWRYLLTLNQLWSVGWVLLLKIQRLISWCLRYSDVVLEDLIFLNAGKLKFLYICQRCTKLLRISIWWI